MRTSYMTMRDLGSIGGLGAEPQISEKEMDLKAKADIDKAAAGQRIYSTDLAAWADLRKPELQADIYAALQLAASGEILMPGDQTKLKEFSKVYFAKYGLLTQAGNWLSANLPGLIKQYTTPVPTAPVAAQPSAEEIFAAQQEAAAAQKRKMINIAAIAGGGAVLIGLVFWMMRKGGKRR